MLRTLFKKLVVVVVEADFSVKLEPQAEQKVFKNET